MRSQYPLINTEKDVVPALRQIQRLREAEDIVDWNNLPQIYMSGRKVGKIPGSSADVTTGDKIGDFNYTASFMYLLVDDSGTPAWRRITLSTF